MNPENRTPAPYPPRDDLVKVVIPLDPSPDDWYDYQAETAWASWVDEKTVRLENVPYAAYGLSLGDRLVVEPVDGRLTMVGVQSRGGHSTYRILLEEGIEKDSPLFQESWLPLEKTGCTYETRQGSRLLAIDIPADTDIYLAYRLLEEGEEAGAWGFEEAHVGHPVK